MKGKPGSFVLALLLALDASGARAENQASGPSQVNELERLGEVDGPVIVPSGDCPVKGGVEDPDGAVRRAEVARSTRLLAASHPAAQAGVILAGGGGGLTGVLARMPRVNFVDEEIFGTMEAAKVSPAPLASDAEFLRRVTLDLTGRIPDASTVSSFLADPTVDKRSRMIDTLLASDAFVDRWAFFYDEMFRNTSNADSGRLYYTGRNAYHAYFVDAVRSHKPYDQMARELLAGAGVNTTHAPANFSVRNIQSNGPAQDTYDNQAATTGTAFLGETAVFCTSCHNGAGHLDQINLWGSTVRRQDFWGMAAFFAKVRMPRTGSQPSDTTYNVFDDPALPDYRLNTTTGNKTDRTAAYYTTIPAGLTVITPTYLRTPTSPQGGAPLPGETYRAAMARLVTADPQFARAAVNYLWKEMFTLGIVEPADNFDLLRQDPSNPPPGDWTIQPTHPNLLTKLAQDFAAHGYDIRSTLALMAKSNAYQISSFYPLTWSDAYAPLFARHFTRRLRSEEIFDAVTKATGVTATLNVTGYAAPVAWAGQLPDINEPRGAQATFLNTFMRGDRDSEARSNEFSISQALSLLNDTTVTNRVKNSAPGSAVGKLIAANASSTTIVSSLYLSTLSRPPTAAELAAGVAMFSNLKAGQTKTTVAEDLQFALLNKIDFFNNY